MIRRCTSIEQDGWLELRQQLWPHCSRAEHLEEMQSFLAEPDRFAQFVAYGPDGRPVGFAESAIRSDYVNGTESSPVAFLEGIYVVSSSRRAGVGSSLVRAVSAWGRELGCSELASDALIDNEVSHAMHRALGFQETERVVFFRKEL